MTFAAPAYLAGLLVVPLLALLLRRGERARERLLSLFGQPALLAVSSRLPTHRERLVRQIAAILAVTLVVIALARPESSGADQATTRSGADILFVLDLSRSMDVADVAPSRLAAAKQAALAIAHALPNDRVGLVVFGGSAFLSLPPTLDHSTFATFIDAAEEVDIPDPSTNLEDAADVVTAALESSVSGVSSAVVFLSDGEDEEGKLEQAIAALNRAQVRAFAVGVGTVAGGVVTDRDSVGGIAPHLDRLGQPVVSHLVELNLRDIARRTGGVYVHWAGSSTDVRPIIAGLHDLPARRRTGQVRSPEAERFQWPLAAALVVLLVGSLVEWQMGSRRISALAGPATH
jgi:Ca-activated chloride channel homolog